MSKTNIYILKLKDNKYYVGKSKDPEKRFLEHVDGNGSTWTAKYEPIEILKVIKDASPFDEDKFVKEYMSIYGVKNVRGGSYVKEVLEEKDLNTLQKEIRNATDCCTKCGNKGHFVKDCYVKNKSKYNDINISTSVSIKTCFDCGDSGHYSSECPNKKIEIKISNKKTKKINNSFKYQTISTCYRCGREGHYANTCYAKSDSNGNALDDESSSEDDSFEGDESDTDEYYEDESDTDSD